MRALVVTASNRAAAGVYEDRGGPLIVEALRSLGFHVEGPTVVEDGEPVGTALRAAVLADYDVVISTGGTGLTPGDLTPEVTRAVIDREIPGIAEAIRAYGTANGVATAALSRGMAGLAGRTLIVNLPGSTGGVRDGMRVLEPILLHAIDQARGGDHVQPASPSDGGEPADGHVVGGEPADGHVADGETAGVEPVGGEPAAGEADRGGTSGGGTGRVPAGGAN